MLPLSAMSEEQRQNQYLADVAQETAEKTKKKCGSFGSERTSDSRQVVLRTSEQPRKVLSISGNLTTLMFIVVSDLSEAWRERLTSSLPLQRINVTA